MARSHRRAGSKYSGFGEKLPRLSARMPWSTEDRHVARASQIVRGCRASEIAHRTVGVRSLWVKMSCRKSTGGGSTNPWETRVACGQGEATRRAQECGNIHETSLRTSMAQKCSRGRLNRSNVASQSIRVLPRSPAIHFSSTRCVRRLRFFLTGPAPSSLSRAVRRRPRVGHDDASEELAEADTWSTGAVKDVGERRTTGVRGD